MAITWNFAYCLLLFNAFAVGSAAGVDNSFVAWSALIIFALVFLVLLVILFFNPEFAWVCWYCLRDLVNKCCPNLTTSQCRGSRPNRGINQVEDPLPYDDEPPPPYEEVVPNQR